MKCPSCGAAELVCDTRTIDGVPAVTAYFCPACGEGVPASEEGDRLAAAQRLAACGGAAPSIAKIPRRRSAP